MTWPPYHPPCNNGRPFGLQSSYTSSFSQDNLSRLLGMANKWNSDIIWCEDSVLCFMRLGNLSPQQHWLLPVLFPQALTFLPLKENLGTHREKAVSASTTAPATVKLCLHDTPRHKTAFIVWDCLGDSTLSAFWTGANERGGGRADKLGWQGEQLKGFYCNANVILKFNHAAWQLNGNFFSIKKKRKKEKADSGAMNEVVSTQHKAKCCFDDESG